MSMANEDYLVIGIDFHHASDELRAKYHLSARQIDLIYRQAVLPAETIVLATCNRTEFFYYGAAPDQFIKALITVYAGQVMDQPSFYRFYGPAVVQHLLELAVGLKSMIIGETEILGQIDDAYRLAGEAGAEPQHLGKLFRQVILQARRIRVRSRIGGYSSSLPTMVVKELKKLSGELDRFQPLILGNGMIAQKIAQAFEYQGMTVTMLTRNPLPPQAVGTERRMIAGYSRLPELLSRHNLIVAATAAPHLLIHRESAGAVVGKVFIDLSFPRNIDPELAKSADCILWDLKYFGAISRANQALKAQAVSETEALCRQAAERLLSKDMSGKVAGFTRASACQPGFNREAL